MLSMTRLDVNISYSHQGVWYKQNLTTISLGDGTTAHELSKAFWSMLDSFDVPVENIPEVTTDGPKVMLGEVAGFHKLLTTRMKWLPNWGGCSCHNLAYILKHMIPKLNTNLISLYTNLQAYLGWSQTLHRQWL